MTTKTETGPGPVDTLKLLVAAAVVVGGVVAYYVFEDESILLRVTGVIVALALGTVIAFQSMQGRDLWRFIQGSRAEIRKVVWPTRQETTQTTMIVVVFVFFMALILWGIDSLLGWLVGMLIG